VREEKIELGNKNDYCSYDFFMGVLFEKKVSENLDSAFLPLSYQRMDICE
jgi:hypothetical protein